MREVQKEEQKFGEKQTEFENENNKFSIEQDALQEDMAKYYAQKEQFDLDCEDIKDRGEKDQKESEQIGYFNANKEKLYQELKKLKEDIEF